MSVCLLTDVVNATVQDAVTKLYSCVVEIKMKAEFEDGCGPSKGAGRRGVGSREVGKAPLALHFMPLAHI